MTEIDSNVSSIQLSKSLTGIRGFDEITGGGLPQGRPTLVCGSAGCGKTLFGIEFLVRGAIQFQEPGVFMSFEESEEELAKNVVSLGFDLVALRNQKKIIIDHVQIERSEIEETGEYDLEGLFVRLGHSIDSIGAKRVVLDTLESLFSGLPNPGILRSEIRRLFRWLKDKGMTTVITAEQGDGTLTRHGLEEYVSDCVIKLDHRVTELISTRRLRVMKYRGSMHGTNEYPFLIDESGVSVLPLTSVGLDYPVSSERISTGIARLDTMLDGKGYFRGSSILLSGTAGTGKTSVAAHLATETCRRGERCLYFAFEESRNQIIRNMRSIGLDLAPWIESGHLLFHGVRPTFYGLEMHLVKMYTLISEFKPHLIIIDPISNLASVGSSAEVKSVLMRLVDFLKSNGITSFFTSLTVQGSQLERTEEGISSLIDTWLRLRDFEADGERNRLLHILKSRGMDHSNQVREFLLTEKGIELVDVYIGAGGVLTGAARVAQEARDTAALMKSRQEIELRKRELERKRLVIDMQIATLRTDFEREEEESNKAIEQEKEREKTNSRTSEKMLHLRKADRV